VLFRNVAKPLLIRMRSPLEVSVTGGARMVVDPSDLIGRELAISGVWEPEVTAAFRDLLTPGDICVDVGANIGYFTLLASGLVGSAGHVYALEPSPILFESLCSNLDLNKAVNVTPLCVAAADRVGQTLLYEGPPKNRGEATTRAQTARQDGTSVPARRLDAVVSAEEVPRLRLVKVDVEGSELDVLRGLVGVFERGGRPAIVVEVTPAWSGDEAAAFLTNLSESFRLQPYRLVRERLLSGRSSSARRPVELTSISGDQEELLLVPEGVSP
jgi:FkbM family methyltransferase